MMMQRIIRAGSVPAQLDKRQHWLAQGRAALREIELAGGSISDLDQAYRSHPRAFCRLVSALRELGAEIDGAVDALEDAAPAAPVVSLRPRH